MRPDHDTASRPIQSTEAAKRIAFEGSRPALRRGIRQALILIVIMLTSLGCYLAVEWGVHWWRGPTAAISTQSEWDRAIPFWPGWVWVYLFPYLLGPVVVGLLSRETFAWYVRRGIPLVATSLLIFILVPTRTVRPDATGIGDSITADLYRNIAAVDGPAANAAPSLHVSLTCLLAVALFIDFPRWRVVSLAGVSIVWLSTLFTHQHHIIDVVSGIALALVFALPVRGTSAVDARS
jgi:hypothetical protein